VWPVTEKYDRNDCKIVSVETTLADGAAYCALLMLLLGCLLVAILIYKGWLKKPGLLLVVVIVILAAVILAYQYCNSRTGPATITETIAELEPGKAYYWRVTAADGQGATVESAMRRFEVQ
jgi:hypothetical protein